jgi:hypothetical protein
MSEKPTIGTKYNLFKDGNEIAEVTYTYDRWHGLCFMSEENGEKTVWIEFDYWEEVK